MVPENFHDFFLGTASVAGALVGLLFVAISVSGSRLTDAEATAPLHRIRAAAALTAFTNALAVSLFALIPDQTIGETSISVGALGLAFILSSLISLFRQRRRHWGSVRDAVFLNGLLVTFAFQVVEGIEIVNSPDHDAGSMETLSILVIVCFLLGISRSWELIGGPQFGVRQEVVALVRDEIKGQSGDRAAGPATAAPADAANTASQPDRADGAGPPAGGGPPGFA